MSRFRAREARFFVAALTFLHLVGAGTLAPVAEGKGVLIVDRFSAERVDAHGIPVGWKLKKPGNSSKVGVEGERQNSFLHILCVNDNIAIGKKLSFSVRQYPYLSWLWKATQLPERGDIRNRETDEQAGQVYVVFPKFPATLNTRSVGYVWDSQAPVGLSGTSTAYSKMKYIVLQSGTDKLNQWIGQTRNVYQDYQNLFQEEPPPLGGFVLYINTQHSKSSAEISYADIFFSSAPPKIQGDISGELKQDFRVSHAHGRLPGRVR